MKIEIWSDVVCPWCAIGKKHLDDALVGFAHADDVEVVLRSFELDPTAPVGGSEPMADVLARKYGLSAGEAAEMMGRVERTAADDGLVMHMATTIHSNTQDAHRLLHLALESGGTPLQATLNAALMDAHFRDGADVADHSVLRSVAVATGLEPDAVDEVLTGDRYADAFAADIRRARAYGATGVPFFVVDEHYGVSGAQPVETFSRVLEQAWTAAHPLQMVPAGDAEVCGPDGCLI